MAVLANIRARCVPEMMLRLFAALALVGGCDSAEASGDAAGDTPAGTEGGAETTDDGPAGAGEMMNCEAPLGAGACAATTICDVFVCGGKDAPYNHFGCPRIACEANADCVSGERCFAVALETGCRAEVGPCGEQDGTCACEGATSCAGVIEAHCLPTGFYPASEDCDVDGLSCDALELRLEGLDTALAAFADRADGQLAAELTTCRDRVVSAQSDCAGQVAP